jgi:hypothetical protein
MRPHGGRIETRHTAQRLGIPLLGALLGALLWLAPACAGSTSTGPGQRETLLQKVERTGNVSVLVRLEVPFTPEGRLDSRGVRRQRVAIRRTQSELRSSLRPHGVRVVARPASAPILALVVDRAALRELLRSPLVRRVQENRPEPPG